MAEREAVPLEGRPDPKFDYLWEDPAAADPGRFDAFDHSDWNFKPAPVPWYRTRRAAFALIAAVAAAAAIVVSLVLLLLRDSSPAIDQEPTPVAPTSTNGPTTSAPPSPPLRVGVAPAPPPPPPPPTQEVTRSPVYRPTQQPRVTKKPEIGVTRTPVTRSPISVAPQPRHPRN